MSNKAKPFKILYIDDNPDDYKRLQMVANPLRIILDHALSFEEGKAKFYENGERNYDGIILDALCLINKNDEIPRKDHAHKALLYFRDNAKSLLTVIYTGETAHAKNLGEILGEDTHIFNKGSNEETENMLNLLVEKAKKKDIRKFETSFPGIFDVFDKGYMDDEAFDELLGCLKNMNSSDFTVIKNTLACLRRLQEKIYIALNKLDPVAVPLNLIEPDIKVTDIYKHLTAEGVVKRYSIIDRYAATLYNVASNNGSHTPYENLNYVPTKYTVQAMVFMMLDLLLWLKGFGDNKQR